MDYVIAACLVALWALTTLLAFGMGYVRGFDAAEAAHKWSRWILNQYENRSIRF
jgi:hypothetical protein